jgi:outer membrane protein
MINKKWLWLPLLFAVLMVNANSAQALEKGDFIARLGASSVSPIDSSNAVTGLANSEVGVDSAMTAGFTVGMMLTDNISLEMLGIYPSNHRLIGKGSISGIDVGEVDVFPPTFHLNYYFMPNAKLSPRIGAGFSTVFYLSPEVAGGVASTLYSGIDVEHTIGLAANVGLDYYINDNWMLTMGVWYIDVDAEATLTNVAGGTSTVDIDVNPIATLFGIGYRF